MRLERVGERAQHARPRAGRERAPRGQRLPRAGDGLVNLGRARAGDSASTASVAGSMTVSVSGNRRRGAAATRRARRRVGSSIVRTGPLKVLLAQPKYQIVTAQHHADEINGA